MSANDRTLTVSLVESISELPGEQWDGLDHGRSPFTRYGFFEAMEYSKSIGPKTGWQPLFVLARDGATNELLGAIPAFIKTHSYGEYIFDWEWARGAQAAGIEYYPKLLVGAPYTPAVGHRLLMSEAHFENAGKLLRLFCTQHRLSSVHILHCLEQESQALNKVGFISRETHQYHFQNDAYDNFDAFLASLKSRHRKQIQKERARAQASPLSLDLVRGDELSPQDWRRVYQLYENTYQRKWGNPYLTSAFFGEMPQAVKESILLATARDETHEIQAMSLSFESDTHLYGRYWGCAGPHDAIHFEFCYYRLLEYAIENKKKVFEAGAQGEHKIKRGFVPVTIHSAHAFTDERLQTAIERFCRSEATQADRMKDFLGKMAPFKGVPSN